MILAWFSGNTQESRKGLEFGRNYAVFWKTNLKKLLAQVKSDYAMYNYKHTVYFSINICAFVGFSSSWITCIYSHLLNYEINWNNLMKIKYINTKLTWVAHITGLPATLHLAIIIFCARNTFSVGISIPKSPRATIMPSDASMISSILFKNSCETF